MTTSLFQNRATADWSIQKIITRQTTLTYHEMQPWEWQGLESTIREQLQQDPVDTEWYSVCVEFLFETLSSLDGGFNRDERDKHVALAEGLLGLLSTRKTHFFDTAFEKMRTHVDLLISSVRDIIDPFPFSQCAVVDKYSNPDQATKMWETLFPSMYDLFVTIYSHVPFHHWSTWDCLLEKHMRTVSSEDKIAWLRLRVACMSNAFHTASHTYLQASATGMTEWTQCQEQWHALASTLEHSSAGDAMRFLSRAEVFSNPTVLWAPFFQRHPEWIEQIDFKLLNNQTITAYLPFANNNVQQAQAKKLKLAQDNFDTNLNQHITLGFAGLSTASVWSHRIKWNIEKLHNFLLQCEHWYPAGEDYARVPQWFDQQGRTDDCFFPDVLWRQGCIHALSQVPEAIWQEYYTNGRWREYSDLADNDTLPGNAVWKILHSLVHEDHMVHPSPGFLRYTAHVLYDALNTPANDGQGWRTPYTTGIHQALPWIYLHAMEGVWAHHPKPFHPEQLPDDHQVEGYLYNFLSLADPQLTTVPNTWEQLHQDSLPATANALGVSLVELLYVPNNPIATIESVSFSEASANLQDDLAV